MVPEFCSDDNSILKGALRSNASKKQLLKTMIYHVYYVEQTFNRLIRLFETDSVTDF